MADKVCRENQNTHFIVLFSKIVPLNFKVEAVCRPGRSTNEIWRKGISCWIPIINNIRKAKARFFDALFNFIQIYNNDCFPTAKMVTRTSLCFELYIQCVICFVHIIFPSVMSSFFPDRRILTRQSERSLWFFWYLCTWNILVTYFGITKTELYVS